MLGRVSDEEKQRKGRRREVSVLGKVGERESKRNVGEKGKER